MVTPALQWIVCVVMVELSDEHPMVADCAAAVAIGEKRACECNAYHPDNRFHDCTSARLIELQNVASKVRR